MKYLKKYTIIGIFFVLIIGTLAHFLYDQAGKHNQSAHAAVTVESL